MADNTSLTDNDLAKRDPHVLPTFDSTSLTNPDAPLLYLPPLLSALPEKYVHPRPLQSSTGDSHAYPAPPPTTSTRLPDIDPASFSLHKALHHFRPIREDYADSGYAESFNWSELELPAEEEREWYCVVFRSKRKEGSKSGPLYDADKLAHEEAVRNGGLIAYWYGVPHPETGLNIATCIWQSRKHAIVANSKPHHVEAMRLTADSYEFYNLERYVLSKQKGETHPVVLSFAGRNDVGW